METAWVLDRPLKLTRWRLTVVVLDRPLEMDMRGGMTGRVVQWGTHFFYPGAGLAGLAGLTGHAAHKTHPVFV